MGKTNPRHATEKLYSLIDRMGLNLHKEKPRKVRATETSFDVLVQHYGLITPTKYSIQVLPVKANEEVFRKAVCGKTAGTV